VAGVVAGATVVGASFADWVEADLRGVGIRRGSGWENVQGQVAHGPWFAALGGVVAIVAALVVAQRAGRSRWLGLGAAMAALGLSVVEVVDLSNPGSGVTAEVLPAIWVLVGAAVVAVLAASASFGVERPPLPRVVVPPPPAPVQPVEAFPTAPPPAPPLLQ